eukprot:gene16146-19448_t
MTDFAPLITETPAEHPFAPFVRILGKGKRGARNLTREEAREAMGMLLDEKVEDTQLGAFLMLLRHKEESPEELAGFTEAVRERLNAPSLNVDVDWPTYAGKKRHLPWYLLAAKCLAQNGVRILMHGGGAHTAGRLYTEQLLDGLQIPLCRNWQQVEAALEQGNLAFIPLGDWAPQLQRMIDLRNTLGLRSPIHSLARILNPLSIEINPDTISHLYGTTGGESWDEEWPALSAQRHVKPAALEPEHLKALWRGEVQDSYPQLALIATMALALRGLGHPREQAFELAQQYWDARDKSI